MSYADRAGWAAQVPWAGIKGRPAWLDNPSLLSDIGQLAGAGFAAGQIPVWNGTKFVPGNRTVGTVIETPDAPEDTPAVATRVFEPAQNAFRDLFFQEVFDVRQYGAPNDESADATRYFESAINALNSNGSGTLYIPFGRYFIGGTIPPISVPCVIRGDGMGVSVLTMTDNGFIAASSRFFGLYGLTIFGGSSTGCGLNITDGTAGTEPWCVQDVRFSGFGYGLQIDTPRPGFLSRVRVSAAELAVSLFTQDSIFSQLSVENGGDNTKNAIELFGDRNQFSLLKVVGETRFYQGLRIQGGDYNTVADSFFWGCEAEAIALVDGTALAGPTRVTDITFGDVQGDPVSFDPSVHFVNELMGVGSNANTAYDNRRDIAESDSWNPGSIAVNGSESKDFTVAGAEPGQQAVYGAPYDLQGLNVSICIPATDTVRVTLHNPTASPVDLGAGTWSVRVLN